MPADRTIRVPLTGRADGRLLACCGAMLVRVPLFSTRSALVQANRTCGKQRVFRNPPRCSQVGCVSSRALSGSGQRPYSSANVASNSTSPLKVSHILSVLLIFGVGATAWGLYDFYSILTLWPEEVRGDLRAALRAKQRGDLKLSMRHFARAWETIQNLSLEKLKANPYLKVSGVAIAYAEVLEIDGHLSEAFTVLGDVLSLFIKDRGGVLPSDTPVTLQANEPTSSSNLTSTSSAPFLTSDFSNSQDVLRAIAIALKLADLAEALDKPSDEEHYLNFAVSEVLRVVKAEYGLRFQTGGGFVQDKRSVEGDAGENENGSLWDALTTEDELDLPTWSSLTRTELAAPFERLAAFSARTGKTEQAITLYRVASSFLTHPKPAPSPTSPSASTPARGTPSPVASPRTSIPELCQALQIENAHMALLMELRRKRPNDERLQRDLPRVITRAARIANEATVRSGRLNSKDGAKGMGIWSGSGGKEEEMALCDQAYPAVLYNAGVYYEEENNIEVALQSYTLAYRALITKGGHKEQAQAALDNAKRLQRTLERRSREKT